MGIGGNAEYRKKSKELKSELKDWRRIFLAAGWDKADAAQTLKMLHDTLERADVVRTDYVRARSHLQSAREAIPELLDDMYANRTDGIQEGLDALLADLDAACHDCLVRADDKDYRSTVEGLRQMAAEKSWRQPEALRRGSGILLRSELENVKSVLDDAAGFDAPDFVALAYDTLYGDAAALYDMENGQRNAAVLLDFEENFWGRLSERCGRIGKKDDLMELVGRYRSA